MKDLTFLEFLQGFRRGDLLSECGERMAEVTAALQAFGGTGSLTIKLPFKVNKAGQIECVPVIKSERPRKAIGAGIFYATDDGGLSRSDPNQMDMLDEIERRRTKDN